MNHTRSIASVRTTSIMNVLQAAPKPLRCIDVAYLVDIDRTTVYNILTSLKMKGLVEKASKGRPKVFLYSITGRVFEEKQEQATPLPDTICGIPVIRRVKGDISITLPRLTCLEVGA
jgi:hypothetical protein